MAMVMTPAWTGAGDTLIAEAGMVAVAFRSMEPCDFSTDRAVDKGVDGGLETIVTTTDVKTVMGGPRASLSQHTG